MIMYKQSFFSETAVASLKQVKRQSKFAVKISVVIDRIWDEVCLLKCIISGLGSFLHYLADAATFARFVPRLRCHTWQSPGSFLA